MLWTDKAKKLLKKYWNIDSLKEKQMEVIENLLLGNDVIGLLPTGYGKSLCYLLPPLLTKKTMIIISPLISLMDDQVEKLLKMNIAVSALHSNNKHKDSDLFEIIDGKIKIIYMSPEYLIKGDGLELINSLVETNQIGYIAIDEAHCISVWGHDFRPEYQKISIIREKYPDIPFLAVTATATNKVVEEIKKYLNMKNPKLTKANFDRPNLYLKCLNDENIKEIDAECVRPYLEKYKNQKIIIYTNTRDDTVFVANQINLMYKTEGRIAEAYHAGMTKGMREQIQHKFSEGEIKIIVSTIAFGMGVDQVVRCVIIFGAPSSIEEYWQQIGRAGRDNLPAETILYFNIKTFMMEKSRLDKIKAKFPHLYIAKNNNLKDVWNFVEKDICRRYFVLKYFNQTPNFIVCNNCDNCCENKMKDLSLKIWDRVMDKKNNNERIFNNTIQLIIKEYIKNVNVISNKKTKDGNDKIITLSISNKVSEIIKLWRELIIENKIEKDNIPDNLKLKFMKKYIIKKKIEKTTIDDFNIEDYKIEEPKKEKKNNRYFKN